MQTITTCVCLRTFAVIESGIILTCVYLRQYLRTISGIVVLRVVKALFQLHFGYVSSPKIEVVALRGQRRARQAARCMLCNLSKKVNPDTCQRRFSKVKTDVKNIGEGQPKVNQLTRILTVAAVANAHLARTCSLWKSSHTYKEMTLLFTSSMSQTAPLCTHQFFGWI
jgi:hypothetical protein